MTNGLLALYNLISPFAHHIQYRDKGLSPLRQTILHLRRNLRVFLPMNQPVNLQPLQCQTQRLKGNNPDISLHFVEMQGVLQQRQRPQQPLRPEGRHGQDLPGLQRGRYCCYSNVFVLRVRETKKVILTVPDSELASQVMSCGTPFNAA